MSSKTDTTGKGELIKRGTATELPALPAAMRHLNSLSDLFNLATGDNYSILSCDDEQDDWPIIEGLESPEVQELMDGYLADIDVSDPKSIAQFAQTALSDIEELYGRFQQNSLITHQIEDMNKAAANSTAFDAESMLTTLTPLFITEDSNPNFWQRLVGEKKVEKPEPRDIKRAVTEVEMDLHEHNVQARMLNGKYERVTRQILLQKENLEKAVTQMENAEARLYIAYMTGRKMLEEWHSDEVINSYIGYMPHEEVPEDQQPDTEYYMPKTPEDWASLTFNLNMRLVRFRNVYLNNRGFLESVPTRMAVIDDLLASCKATNAKGDESWKKTAKKISDTVELIRADQSLEEVKLRADRLVESRENHRAYIKKLVGKGHVSFSTETNAETRAGKQPNLSERIREASQRQHKKYETDAAKINDEFNRLCRKSDHYRTQLGKEARTDRPSDIIKHAEELHKQRTQKSRGWFS